jgi:hypothetical protein
MASKKIEPKNPDDAASTKKKAVADESGAGKRQKSKVTNRIKLIR